MKIRNLWCAILLLGCTLLTQKGNAQITNLDYQIRYNTTTCRWDCFIVINGGSATSAVQRAQSNAQYSIVVPTGSTVNIGQNFNPIQNNQTYTGTTPMVWQKGSVVISPAAEPQSDFHSIVPTLVPSSFFNNLATGDTVRLFSLNINPMPNCGSGVRIFRNGIDPNSSAPGMGGGDFSNGYTVGGTAQRYRTNLPQRNPPPPALSASTTCSRGIEIDLTATTNACQTPLTYVWSGPNGYSGTSQDVSIISSTPANAGQYMVTVTDSKGCKSTTSITAISKPNAGNNINACPLSTQTISGSNPNTGTWSAFNLNPPGASFTPGSNGQATVALGANASGVYKFIYDIGACKDTMDIIVNPINAGSNPPNVSCYLSGTTTLNATGTGTWSLGAGSAGIATIANPSNPSSTVSGFSASGTYYFVWTSGICKDTVEMQAGNDCGCTVSNNTLAAVSPSTFCGLSGNINITGGNASPAGGTYLWMYSLNNGLYANAPGTNNQQNYTTQILGGGTHRFRRIYSVPGFLGCSDTSNVILITVNNIPVTPSNLTANPNPACLGQTINLSVTNVGGVTYQWSASSSNAGLVASTASSTNMTPLVASGYVITVTSTANGCTSSPATIIVQVYDTPPTPTAGTVFPVNPTTCNGTNGMISLSGLALNAEYSISYTRNGVDQSVFVTSNGSGIANITGLSAAIYANFVIVSADGCPSGLYAGPVNLVDPNTPTAPTNLQANPNPACLNAAIALSVSNNPGATYNWSSSSPGAGLGNSMTNTNSMLPTSSGIFTIVVTQTVAGCTSPSVSLGVTVNALPATPSAGTVTSSNPTVCGGSNGTISISGYAPNTSFSVQYVYNSNPVNTNITSNGSGVIAITGLLTGTYTNFQISTVSGCTSGVYQGPVVLTDPATPAPPANLTAIPNPVCLGNAVSLSVANTPGATYTWSASSPDAGLTLSSAHTTSMIASAPGSYTISVVQNFGGCTSTAAQITVVVNNIPPGLGDTNVTGANPSTCGGSNGQINISNLANNTTYTLQYTAGSTPMSVSVTSNASGVVNLTGLVAGIYSNFRITNAAGCQSDMYAGPVVLSDPGATPAPTNLNAVPNPACAGATVNLSVSGVPGATFIWSSNSSNAGLGASSSNSNWMMPTIAGTYVISVTQSVGSCSSLPATISVVINPVPATPTAGNITFANPVACAGSNGSISISGYAPGTNYTISYSKNNISSTASVTANASGILIINNLTAGVYSNFIVTNTEGCASGLFAGPVNLNDPNSPPAPSNLTALPNPACLGVPVNLSVNNTPGATYTWTISSPNGGLSTSTSRLNTMNATVAGTYTVQVSQTVAGCTSPSSSLQVVVNANPATPDANTVFKVDPTCDFSNGSISISGLVSNAAYSVNYLYNSAPRVFNGTANAGGILTMNNLAGGQYTNFSLTSAQGCSSGVYTGIVNLINPGLPPAPIGIRVSPDFICVKKNVQLSVDLLPGATYNWVASSPLAGLLPGSGAEVNMIPTEPGLYTITVTQIVNGCTSQSTVTTVEVRGDCYNPDFSVTYKDIQVIGIVSTNDGLSGVTYTSVLSLPGNPSSCIPILQSNGSYSFTCGVAGVYNFRVSSCVNSCESVPLVITVLDENSNNKPPAVNHDYARTRMNVSVGIEILENDRCQNSSSCSLNNPSMVTPPTKGTYNMTTRRYTPNSNFVGIDSFRYEICQIPAATPVNCQRAWVYIAVISGQAPNLTNAMDDYVQTKFNSQLNRSAAHGVLANDEDPEGNSQTVNPLVSTVPGVGNLTLNADGSYIFTPASGFYGPYSWVYEVCDNNPVSACDRATLNILVEPEILSSNVGNFVWTDLNANGIQDAGEPGMANCQVRLYNNSGVMVASTTTGANGQYQFSDVTAGTYFVKVMTPANHVYSPANVGLPTTDSDITGALGAGTTNFFNLLPGEDRMDIDAGLYVCARVSGFLWYDYQMNDIKDNFENGLNGIFVYLWRNVNGTFVKWAETTTSHQPGTASEDGYFNFSCVPPGQYYLQVDLPLIGLVRVRPNIGTNPTKDSDITNANGHMTTNTFALTPGQHKTDFSGGFYPMANAGNLVWIDENVNGIQDPGEPTVSGVVVEARDPQTNAVKGSAVTNENGEYNIDYLEKSDVYLKFNLPQVYSSYSRTFARVGDDAYNSDVDNSFGNWTTRAVGMSPNVTNEHIDLGIVLGALPVTWVDVEVNKDNNGSHVVSWITAQEVNVSHFEVERSLGNTNSFVTIVEKVLPQPGQNINKFYNILDRDNQKFGVYYYRIKQVDLDGKFAYSNTVSIRNNESIDVNIYPSPAIQKTTVSVQLPVESDIRIDVYDTNARLISNLLETSRFDKGDHQIDLDISRLQSGVYNVSIMINQQSITKKLIVLDK